METRHTWLPHVRRKAARSGSGSNAFLRFMGLQASCRRPSISASLAVAVLSCLERKLTGEA